MKLLLTHRFFWPDTAPYAVILRAIGDALAEEGHEVHVLSSMPSYRAKTCQSETPRSEALGALNVQRIRVFGDEKRNPLRRLANAIIYCWALFVTVVRLRPDIVTASTFPPVIAAWSASLAAQFVGAKFVYHIQDIHPEVSTYSGGRLGKGLPRRFLHWLDNQTLRRSAAIVVLSQDMAETLKGRGIGDLPLHVINNFSLDLFDTSETPPVELCKRPGQRRVIFAGNLGRFQNLPQLAEGVSTLFSDFPDLELFFLGDGSALTELKTRWGEHPQVGFGQFLPFTQAKSLIADADVGLVSLEKDLYRVAYPSKIATYLTLGLPILALIEKQSDIARQIEIGQLGAVVANSDPQSIAVALAEMLNSTSAQTEQINEWVSREVDTKVILPRWVSLVENLIFDR